MRAALEAGRTDPIGLDRAFVFAFPPGDKPVFRPRSPFHDDTARALADQSNLEMLAGADVTDRGARDIWETIVATGRRAGEVLDLRLDCIGLHNGVPLLWHDQSKVGNYNEAIRIPDYTLQRLRERQRKTVTRFQDRYARTPTAEERATMALFPRGYKNPHGTYPVSHSRFHTHFRRWVLHLDLGPAVPHQARHTLATKLLAAGASLQHIKRYLGHVSERMTEHYAEPRELRRMGEEPANSRRGQAIGGAFRCCGTGRLIRDFAVTIPSDCQSPKIVEGVVMRRWPSWPRP
ncbi:tyrosine-type recombinase/integrase [Phytohabitans sp. LJ34]|uniref:tyrosine-type recombinase/integrase n=1 Tax=Phytohabitans sp. LJ34 TaxID=3452217 RepID=UPI003F8C1757